MKKPLILSAFLFLTAFVSACVEIEEEFVFIPKEFMNQVHRAYDWSNPRWTGEKEFLDFNFDGHDDYRMWNGKDDLWDVYIFSAKNQKFEKHVTLSKIHDPFPNKEKKVIESSRAGEHSPKVFITEVYEWDSDTLRYKHTISQFPNSYEAASLTIRVTTTVVEGRPRVVGFEYVK